MLSELDLLHYYPLFNCMFTVCSVVAIANLKGNKVTIVMIFTGGALSLAIPYLVPYANAYYFDFLTDYISELFLGLAILSAFILQTIEAKQYMGGDTFTIITTFFSAKPNASVPGGSGGNVGTSGPGDSAEASSSRGNTTGASAQGSRDPAVRVPVLGAPGDPKHTRAAMPDHIREILKDPKDLLEAVTTTTFFDNEAGKVLSDKFKNEILQAALKDVPAEFKMHSSISKRAFPYWQFKQIHTKAIFELKVIDILDNRLNPEDRINSGFNVHMYKHQFLSYKNHAFYRMQEEYDKLNSQDRKTIKKHMTGAVKPDTTSGSENDD